MTTFHSIAYLHTSVDALRQHVPLYVFVREKKVLAGAGVVI